MSCGSNTGTMKWPLPFWCLYLGLIRHWSEVAQENGASTELTYFPIKHFYIKTLTLKVTNIRSLISSWALCIPFPCLYLKPLVTVEFLFLTSWKPTFRRLLEASRCTIHWNVIGRIEMTGSTENKKNTKVFL